MSRTTRLCVRVCVCAWACMRECRVSRYAAENGLADLRAKGGVHVRELEADVAGADDGHPVGNPVV